MCEKLDGTPGTAVKIELKRAGPGWASNLFGSWACASLPVPFPSETLKNPMCSDDVQTP